MSKSSTNNNRRSSSSPTTLRPEDYAHSPVHFAVAIADHTALSKIISTLPRLDDPSRILNESDSLAQENIAVEISAVLDRRDNPHRETPLHLAVRLNDAVAVRILAHAGANLTLQNATGWCPLQEAILHRCSDITKTLVQQHHSANWYKWRSHLPRLVAVLHRMRDFYMEISFHFESSVVPFVGKFAPSDTYKIWKRDGNLRADTTLSGLKTQRSNQSFLFLGDDDESLDIPSGSLLVLNHDKKKIFDAFEGADSPLSDSDIASYCNQTSVHRPGVDVTKAELVSRSNWRKQDRVESVGEWKARVYDVHNVVVSFRSRRITSVDGSEQILPLDLELEEDSEEGFLVAENPRFSISSGNLQGRRHSSFVREERELVTVSRKSVDIIPEPRKRMPAHFVPIAVAPPPQTKEKETVKSVRPQIWLTEQFPLKTEELLPLLDILANKVKAIRRMRELLTTTFPPGTFPVKVAIPVVPTVRLVITFTKFVELQPVEEFYTPMSSPSPLECSVDRSRRRWEEEDSKKSKSNSSFGWLSRSSSRSSSSGSGSGSGTGTGGRKQQRNGGCGAHIANPFEIPSGYSWGSSVKKSNSLKKSKSVRKASS